MRWQRRVRGALDARGSAASVLGDAYTTYACARARSCTEGEHLMLTTCHRIEVRLKLSP